jgi:hypothetical protein
MAEPPPRVALIAAYKRLLQDYVERRPSGMRLQIAKAIGRHKSFVSQITNPAYAIPVPARHLETIFEICHFSREERDTFLAAYCAAHPKQVPGRHGGARKGRTLRIALPPFDDPEVEREVEETIQQFAGRVIDLARKRQG